MDAHQKSRISNATCESERTAASPHHQLHAGRELTFGLLKGATFIDECALPAVDAVSVCVVTSDSCFMGRIPKRSPTPLPCKCSSSNRLPPSTATEIFPGRRGKKCVSRILPSHTMVRHKAAQPFSSHLLPLKRITTLNVLASRRTMLPCLGDANMRLHAPSPGVSSSWPPTLARVAAIKISSKVTVGFMTTRCFGAAATRHSPPRDGHRLRHSWMGGSAFSVHTRHSL